MDEYMTIAEAVAYTGTSDSTIRRLIKKSQKDPKSPYYKLSQKRSTEHGSEWVVSKAYIDVEYGKVGHVTSHMTSQKRYNGNHSDIEHISQNEKVTSHDYNKVEQVTSHEPKNDPKVTSHSPIRDTNEKLIGFLEQQLAEKDKQIGELLKRQSETNILLHNYQTKLLGKGEAPNNDSIISDQDTNSDQKTDKVEEIKKQDADKVQEIVKHGNTTSEQAKVKKPTSSAKKKRTKKSTKKQTSKKHKPKKEAKKPNISINRSVPKPPNKSTKPKKRGLFGLFGR